MLNRDTSPANPEQYYLDSVLNKPSAGKSSFDNFARSFSEPFEATNLLDPLFAESPQGKQIRAAKDALDIENNFNGISTGQDIANKTANLLGFALSPISLIGGGAGSLAARGLGRAVATAGETLLPDAATSLLNKPLSNFVGSKIGGDYLADKTIGSMAQKTAQAFGAGVGSDIPTAAIENYNFDTKHVEWGGVARDASQMGGMAIAIDSIPFAYGVIRGKINRGLEVAPGETLTPEKINQGLQDGLITPEEHQWLLDYEAMKKTPEDVEGLAAIEKRATQLTNENKKYADTATNQVPFDLITPKDMESLKNSAADQMTADVPDNYKTSLTDFIAHNSLDEMRENPQSIDGIRGYVDHINEKLEAKPEKMRQADELMDQHLTTKVTENMPFSQKELMKMMKQSNFDVSHIEHMPLSVPENLQRVIKLDNRIKQLKEKVRKVPNKQTERRIAELAAQKPKVLTPKEELNHLRQKLTNRESTSRIEKMPEYQRLTELAQVWKNAKHLLDRVHLEEQYKKQEAFKNLFSEILNFSDSDVGKIANRENVSAYLSERLQSKFLQKPDLKSSKEEVDQIRDVPVDSETTMREQTDAVNKIKAGELNKEFIEASEKFNEFKKSPNVFKNLISCIIGGLGG